MVGWPVLVQAFSGPRMPPVSQEVSQQTAARSRPSRTVEWYFHAFVSVSFVLDLYPALASEVVVMFLPDDLLILIPSNGKEEKTALSAPIPTWWGKPTLRKPPLLPPRLPALGYAHDRTS